MSIKGRELTVKDYLDFTKEQLETFCNLSNEAGDYWENSYKFYEEKENVQLHSLSAKQKGWLDKIYDGVYEEFEKNEKK